MGIFQTGWGAGADKAFCSEQELEQSKIRRFQLRKRYKFNNISKREMKRKTDSYQSCHVCDVWGWGRYILPGLTGTFYPEPKLEPPKTFPASHPCFQDLHKTGKDGCKALTYRLSIGRFDETLEKRISKQELS